MDSVSLGSSLNSIMEQLNIINFSLSRHMHLLVLSYPSISQLIFVRYDKPAGILFFNLKNYILA